MAIHRLKKEIGLFIGGGSTGGVIGSPPVYTTMALQAGAEFNAAALVADNISSAGSMTAGAEFLGNAVREVVSEMAITAGAEFLGGMSITPVAGYNTISQVSTTTTAFAFTGGVAQVPVPSAIPENALIILVAACSQSGTFTTPSGFSEMCDPLAVTAGDDQTTTIFYKIAGASESGTYDLDNDSSGHVRGWCFAMENVDTSNPFDVTPIHASHHVRLTNPAATFEVAGITTNTPNAAVVQISIMSRTDTTEIATSQSGATELINYPCGPSNGANNCLAHYEEQASPDAYPACNHTYTDMVAGTDGVYIVFALRPTEA